MKEQLNTAFGNLIEKLQGWLNAIVESLPNFVLALIVLVAAYFVARYVNSLMNTLVSKKVEQKSISNIIAKISAVLVVLFGLFLALGILNLNQALTSLLTGAGVAGLVVGLALQGTLSNTVSGIVLSFRDKIRIGNWVETNGYAGEVLDINLKNFILKEADNNVVIIPNKTILENPLKNYSLTTKMRVKVECGVGYESNLEFVERLTKETLAKSFKELESKDSVEFFFTEFGGSSINFMARFWIEGESSIEILRARNKAIIEIKKAFDNENINIPFPIRTLQFDNKLALDIPTELEQEISKN